MSNIEPHNFNWKLKGCPQFICVHCGLMLLNNDFTRWCVQKGCSYSDHPDYENQKKNVRAK